MWDLEGSSSSKSCVKAPKFRALRVKFGVWRGQVSKKILRQRVQIPGPEGSNLGLGVPKFTKNFASRCPNSRS